MAELENCPYCDKVFVKSQFHDICNDCWKEEELRYETVYQYIRKRENRTATMEQVVIATGIEETLILKFIRTGKLKLAQFPNLGYPCDKCGAYIREGKICQKCAKELRKDINTLQAEEERKKQLALKEKQGTYFSINNK
ncbi:TIGR03826 family flagellar region protein [Bacillus infantis]|uniref:TIGR03826 family flagellar region protein n=1 Tax=Bacillus infantis TaxID=324767 RepID=UPI003CF5DA29